MYNAGLIVHKYQAPEYFVGASVYFLVKSIVSKNPPKSVKLEPPTLHM